MTSATLTNKDNSPTNVSKDDDGASGTGHATTSNLEAEEEEDTNTIKSSEPDAKNETKTPSLGKFLGLARPEWPMLGVSFFLMVAAEAGSLYNPILLADAYNYLVDTTLGSDQRMSEINRVMVLVLIIHAASIGAGFLRGTIMRVAGERVVARVRQQLYAHLLRQEISFFDQHKTGELVSRLGSDTTLLQQATSLALPEIVLGMVKLCVSVGLMFWISASLAGMTLGCVFVIFAVCIPFGKTLGKLSKAYQDILGEAQTHSTEALGGMRTVQSFAAEEREAERYRHFVGDPDRYPLWWPTDHKTHKTTYSVGFFKSFVFTGFYTFIFGLGFGALYVSLWYGFKLVNDGEITLGDLTAFQSYVFQIGAGLGQTSGYISQFLEGYGASGRIFFLLERVPEIPKPRLRHDSSATTSDEPDMEEPLPPQKPAFMTGAISFNNVDFSYPSRLHVPVLQNFCLSIPPNTTAALVGSSGAGKSTVVSLVQRFYDATAGSVTVDGIDVKDLDLSWLRSHIGYVQQEPQLFGRTVRENVTYGLALQDEDGKERSVTQEELEDVCRRANAHDFIMAWPEGYETMVGERGIKISGGQKQRLAIARALLVNPRILLLDEATSALDAESEHLVQEAIEKAVLGRTVVIVAHRLSTIRRATQIVVLDDHKIVDVGSHDLLLDRCDKYRDLIKRQSVITRGDATLSASMSSSLHTIPTDASSL